MVCGLFAACYVLFVVLNGYVVGWNSVACCDLLLVVALLNC